jgi:hypothetical protein
MIITRAEDQGGFGKGKPSAKWNSQRQQYLDFSSGPN